MKTETQQLYRERILKVLVYIQGHLDDDLSLDRLAKIAYFSPFHFHRVFKGLVGESVKEYIRRLRLERSVYQLRSTNRTVLDIALDAGYETHESYTRAFQGMFGDKPSVFRRNHRKAGYADSPASVHYGPGGRVQEFNPITGGGGTMEVKIKKIEPIRVAFMRHVGPYEKCGKTWEMFCSFLGRKGMFGPKTRLLGISHDDPEVTSPDKIRYDACVTVDESFQPEGEVGVQVIPGGEYAAAIHQGPYERLAETYNRLIGEWAPQSGRVLKSGPCFEQYLNDPNSTKPEDLLTEVHVPLE